MRSFNSMLFMGSRASKEQIAVLRKRFNEGLDLLSALQQPDHSDSEESAKSAIAFREEAQKHLDDVVKDLVVAFTGKELYL